jgi:hypothetical protein
VNQFDWNTLRVGDAVLVHHPLSALPRIAVASRVAFVRVLGRRPNEVGTRAEAAADRRVTWPNLRQVHRSEGIEACPWCAAKGEATPDGANDGADMKQFFLALDRMRATVEKARRAHAGGPSVETAAAEADLEELERRGRVQGYLA